ncbi:MAG: Rrf2 family transcriptional regulator [Alphaproteobacteria bacterium]|jgi:Rrf2 family transcriptional regulator, iron-sulfur cluster assembly transcription factor|nr:Rrf2 family transcriptional regulator [Alphaproteobacteria bacterium]MBT5390474.1 Rrf2 family transcriptional regulator [Alphaproteobacteria bacterium]MBT5654690.1 Rrf2 family transcriptional regulator [Alphaproteobacteria bacterium]
MHLGTKGRYAVMAMVELAQSSAEKALPLSIIAEKQQISLPYLEQLFSRLRKGGIVESVRGPSGGYRLAREMEAISVADIMIAAGETLHATRCSPHETVGCLEKGSRCLVHTLWEELGNQVSLFLRSVSLKDVCERRVVGTSQLMNLSKEAPAPRIYYV